ncbi:MAG: hypothetical protein LBP22_12525 [Deltaproteobacteria bacterium]|jgi:hypothetical protein|nr:hypothetical protein [Deltaproteobacteria bacterium]
MNSIDGRVNGQSAYPAATPSRQAWREEMLGQFLNKIKDHSLPAEPAKEAAPVFPKPAKGNYINIYV